MRNRVLVTLLAVLASAWPGLAGALEFPQQGPGGPPLGTSASGFVGVLGPYPDAPPGQFRALPPPAVAQAPSCPTCPASGPARDQPAAQPAQPQPAQR
jgi:hypothetical protein